MNAAESTVCEAQTLHVFETRSSAREFREVTGEAPDNIIDESIGWRLGEMLPQNATVYLWTEPPGATTFKWVDEIAATAKATLKWPTIPVHPETGRYRGIGNWIRDGANAGDLANAMVEAEIVENTNDRTDRDLLAELKKKADAMTEEEFGREMIENDKRAWLMHHKYSEDDDII